MRVYLVRHAESESNVNERVLLEKADRDLTITPKGHGQAQHAGEWLGNYIKNASADQKRTVKLRHSPYMRTKQTTENILKKLGHSNKGGLVHSVEENELLHEQNLGHFAGYTLEERAQLFPEAQAHFQKEWSEGRSYWAPRPGGESREDTAKRMDAIIPEILADENNGITDLVIVGHGIAHRLLVKQLTGKSVEEFDKEPNPGNCHIRLLEIENGKVADKGYIYQGHSYVSGVANRSASAARAPGQ